MTDARNEQRRSIEQMSNDMPRAETPRRCYQQPRLRHIGSVRDLTLGSTGPNSDELGDQQ